MSPEQCLGTREVDHRSDVYSLGVILFELLAGRPPFVSEGFGELLSMHLHEPPPSLRQFAPQVTPETEQVVLRMLAKKPEERFQSMAEVRAALAAAGRLPNVVSPEQKIGSTDPFGGGQTLAAQTGQPKTVPPTTLTPGGMAQEAIAHTTMKLRKKPWLAVGIGAAIVVAAVVTAVALRNPPAPPTPAVRPAPPPAPVVPPPAKAPATVRVRLESTPAGARVLRVRDGVVLGTTPETIELQSTGEPLLLRIDKDGFVAATREVSLASDTNLSVVLEAAGEAPAPTPAPKKHTPSRTPARPSRDEPAKL
jgi:serine/threonine-protein kinase